MNNNITLLLIIIIATIIVLIWRTFRKPKPKPVAQLPPEDHDLLEKHVKFYKGLDATQQNIFRTRVAGFLQSVRITGVNTEVTELDKLLVAASAIIPIAAFPDWEYRNIDEVLLYPGGFNKEFEQTGANRNVLGMVGDGSMNRQMILSQQSLRDGFLRNDGHNTGIHEFVHLIDKADGAVDGIPEYLVHGDHIAPWVRMVHREIEKMREHPTDVNPYGATNEQEFFAVISEYFFERPQELQKKHPQLYAMLQKMFSGAA